MSVMSYHWKNVRDYAGVETANRLILLFSLQALRYPERKIKNIDSAQEFNDYMKIYKKLCNYHIFERSNLWEDEYKSFLTDYFNEDESELEKGKIKNFRNKFYEDFFNFIKLHSKSYIDNSQIIMSWSFPLIVASLLFLVTGYTMHTDQNGWQNLLIGLSFFVSAIVLIFVGLKDLIILKSKNYNKILKRIDNELCFEKLNEELDIVSSYFTEEAKKRQIIDLKQNEYFMKLSEKSKEFEFLVIWGIEEEFFMYDGKNLCCRRENFPNYVIPTFLQYEKFFTDYIKNEENPLPFYEAMKKELDVLFGRDTKRCGGTTITAVHSAWVNKDIKKRMEDALKGFRESLKATKI